MIDETEFHKGMKRLERIVRSYRECMEIEGREDRKANVCNICGHKWKANPGHPHPRECPRCRSSYWDEEGIRSYECFRCGYSWLSPQPPTRCPRCRSRTWGSVFLEVRCRRCGTRWRDRVSASAPMACPECGNSGRDSMTVSPSRGCAKDQSGILSEDIISKMRSAGDPYFKALSLVSDGLSHEHAGIIARFDSGRSAASIACEMSLSVADVMAVVRVYTDLSESMENAG